MRVTWRKGLPRVWVACSRRLGRRGLATAASLCLVWGLAITVMPLALTPRAALPLEAQPAVRRIHQQEDSDYSGTKVLRDDEPLRGLAPDLGAPHRAGEQQAAVPPPYASAGHEHEGSLKLDSNPSDLRLGNAVARQSNSHTGAGMSLRGAGAKSRIFAPIEPKLSPADDTGLEPEEDEEAALADGGEGRMQEDAGSPNEGPYTLPILKAPKDSKGRAGPQKPLGYLAKVGASGDVVRRSVEDAEVRDEAASHVVPFRSSRGVYSGGGGVFPMRPVQFQHKAGVGDQQALDQQVQDQQAQDQQAQKKEAQDPEEQAQMLALAAIMHGKKVTATQQQLVQQLSPTKRRKLELRTKDLQHRQEKAYLKQLRERGQVVAAEGGGELILSSPRTALRMPALLKRHQPSDWPPEYRIFLNATFSPWVDDACKSLQVRFASPHSLPTRALASFPSSGNTWLRFLIEGATGIFTGSLYDDSSLTKKGMYGEAVPHDAGITVMQKTHGYTTGDAMKVPHEQQCLLCGAAAENLSFDVNPSCSYNNGTCDMPWLVDVLVQHSDNPEDAQYHHLWGGVGAPTLIAMQTSPGTNISVDWEAFTSHSPRAVQVSPQPYNLFGVSIDAVILFDDAHDEGSIENVEETAQIWLPSSLFEWHYEILDNSSSSLHFSLYASSFNGTNFEPNSGLYLNVKSTAGGHRAEERPQLYCPASAAAVDLILDRLVVNVTNPHPSNYPPHVHNHVDVAPISGFNSPRYAVRLVMFSNEGPNSTLVHAADRSIDDEYAPGIFKLHSITTERAREGQRLPEGGYLQWRPVSYLSSDRDVNNATLPSLSAPSSNASDSTQASPAASSDSVFDLLSSEVPPDMAPLTSVSESLRQSLAYAVLGDALTDVLSAHTLVSFGEPEDGYYTSSYYTVWSLTAGSGSPPSEGLSSSALIVIIVGLGLPVVAMLLAVIGLGVWRLTRRPSSAHVALLSEET